MDTNVGKTDRIIRTVVAVILIILGWLILKNNLLGFILNLLASYLLLTMLTSKCWVYRKLNRSTLPRSGPPAASAPTPM